MHQKVLGARQVAEAVHAGWARSSLVQSCSLEYIVAQETKRSKHWHTQQPPRKASTCDKPLLFNATVKVVMKETRLRSPACLCKA